MHPRISTGIVAAYKFFRPHTLAREAGTDVDARTQVRSRLARLGQTYHLVVMQPGHRGRRGVRELLGRADGHFQGLIPVGFFSEGITLGTECSNCPAGIAAASRNHNGLSLRNKGGSDNVLPSAVLCRHQRAMCVHVPMSAGLTEMRSGV